jgi:broad specificity phosphatase PhoE
MTILYLLRHGPTVENGENRIQGQRPGTLLIPETERYIAALSPLLKGKGIQMLLSSDLERAIQTRDILKKFLQQPSLKEGVSSLLREKAMGFYEGMLWSEVPEQFREQRGKNNYDFRSFGGENEIDVHARVEAALWEFARRYPNMRVCCVTHSGWLNQLVSLADNVGVLPDQWSNRSAIYEAGLGPVGQLRYFHPLEIETGVDLDPEE